MIAEQFAEQVGLVFQHARIELWSGDSLRIIGDARRARGWAK